MKLRRCQSCNKWILSISSATCNDCWASKIDSQDWSKYKMLSLITCQRCGKNGRLVYSGCHHCWSKEKEVAYKIDQLVKAKNIVVQLDKELDDVQKAPITVAELQGELEKCKKQIEHLTQYAEHYSTCDRLSNPLIKCSCGLDVKR